MYFSYFLLFFENIFKQNPWGLFRFQLSKSQDCAFISAGTFSVVLLRQCPEHQINLIQMGNLRFLENFLGSERALNKTIREIERKSC